MSNEMVVFESPGDLTRDQLLRDKLTLKEISFCTSVVGGDDPAYAYKQAYRHNAGPPYEAVGERKLCSREASRIMSRTPVRRYVEFLTGQTVESAIISTTEILTELRSILFDPNTSPRDKIVASQTILGALAKATPVIEGDTSKNGSIVSILDALEKMVLQE